MDVIKVAQLEITNFRRFHEVTIPIGDYVTVIAGQNGTSKSTLLGMLAQPFSFGVIRGRTAKEPDRSVYIRTYHDLVLQTHVDLSGRFFMYDCDNVFRLSRQFDFGKDYEYKTTLIAPQDDVISFENNTLLTKSRKRTKGGNTSGMRFVTGPGASHEVGEGNFPHPVIYLGLNRLWPLAETRRCVFLEEELEDGDREWYIEKYNEILCLSETHETAKFMHSKEKKRFLTPKSNDYDGESCSAGQDNLSQILTAILSFRRLRTQLSDRYRGGLLLIDELDATLHAYAQKKLLEELCRVSTDLGLQIVVTSHSQYLLKQVYESRARVHVKPIFLVNIDREIQVREFLTYDDMCDNLQVEVTQTLAERRTISVVFEDEVGRLLFNHICGNSLRKYVKCADTSSLGAGQLKNLADMSKAIPLLNSVVFIPDGDMEGMWKRTPMNILPLPGKVRPETLIYQHLFELSESDPFWISCGSSYNKQYAITSKGGVSKDTGNDKRWVKNWYAGQKRHWGRGCHIVFKSWINSNKDQCRTFCEKFFKVLRDPRFRINISQSEIDRVLSRFRE